MRELELLPAWYTRAKKRRRLVLLQGWIVITLTVALIFTILKTPREIRESIGPVNVHAQPIDPTASPAATNSATDETTRHNVSVFSNEHPKSSALPVDEQPVRPAASGSQASVDLK